MVKSISTIKPKCQMLYPIVGRVPNSQRLMHNSLFVPSFHWPIISTRNAEEAAGGALSFFFAPHQPTRGVEGVLNSQLPLEATKKPKKSPFFYLK